MKKLPWQLQHNKEHNILASARFMLQCISD